MNAPSAVMMIDLLVSILSSGLTTREIGQRDEEFGVSQLFIAFDLGMIIDDEHRNRVVQNVTDSLLETMTIEPDGQVFFPGQRMWLRREENLQEGIPVDPGTWEKIVALG